MSSEADIRLPPKEVKWATNEASSWPKVSYEDLVDYLLLSKAFDGKAMKSFRSLYAYNYVQNGWLGDILSCKHEEINFLMAKVSPSQPGVGRSDYTAWVAVGEDCTILTGHCTCPASEGRSCSHISAIVYAVWLAWTHGAAGETCTDKPKLWGRGAGKAVLQDKLENIDFKRPKLDAVPVAKVDEKENTPGLPRIQQFLDPSDLEEHVNSSCTKPLWNCKGTMLYKILHAKEKPVIEKFPLGHGVHEVDKFKPVQLIKCQPCKEFYDKYVNLSDVSKDSICDATTSQNSPLWQDVRKLRISSSKVSPLPKTTRADPNKFVTNQIYPRFKGNSATQHGLKYESTARSWFEQVTGKKVQESGVVIKRDEPYIAASPDGIIDDSTILEVKCPTKPLSELINSGKYDIVLKDNVPVLNPKGRNGYYTQVQMAMYCTERVLCKFVVWTQLEKIIVEVPYDLPFVTKCLERLRQFYFQHLLVRLADENHFNRLQICDQYKSYCRV